MGRSAPRRVLLPGFQLLRAVPRSGVLPGWVQNITVSCTSQQPEAIFLGKKLPAYITAVFSFVRVFSFGDLNRLPLHVVWAIRPPITEWYHVIHDVTRAWALPTMGGRARIELAELVAGAAFCRSGFSCE